MKPELRGKISVLLIISAFIIGSTTQSGFSFGREIFLDLGLPIWTNGRTGFNYVSIISLIILFLGIILAKTEVPRRRVGILILFLIVLSPMLISIIEPVYFKMHKELAAVQYDSKRTHFNVRSSEDNKHIIVQGTVVLTNDGKNPVTLSMKIAADSNIERDWFWQDIILFRGHISEEPGVFTLLPGETQTIPTFSTIPSKNVSSLHGSINGPNLILFMGDEVRRVGY
ncbi:MAG TPA: hypothetical protein GX523_09800 [Desulfitobacterium dehalogenans]|uniref:Uncharacterized protein n=1 Tax=Desulfitobacterium dehalogenans TaxID=36854 RepID=A0A7C7D5U9_9FIRM|nr:hypothetical protein [Desulfitobacterium dehalogenans]